MKSAIVHDSERNVLLNIEGKFIIVPSCFWGVTTASAIYPGP